MVAGFLGSFYSQTETQQQSIHTQIYKIKNKQDKKRYRTSLSVSDTAEGTSLPLPPRRTHKDEGGAQGWDLRPGLGPCLAWLLLQHRELTLPGPEELGYRTSLEIHQ